MRQINIAMKQKQTHRYGERTYSCQGEVRIGSLGLAEANYFIQDRSITRSYCIAQGTIFNIP